MDRKANSHSIFDGGGSYIAKWLLMVCFIKQRFQIADMGQSNILKMTPYLCRKITLCFVKVRVILFFVQVLAFTKMLILLLVYQQISMTRYN